MRRWLLLIGLLLLPGVASAQTTVGPTCTISWNAVTTNADGSPIVGTVFYKVWILTTATPVPLPGTTPPTASTTSPAVSVPCPSGMTTGSKFAWVNAWTSAGGESALSTTSTAVPPVPAVPLAFTYVSTASPAAPTGLKVGP